MWNFGKNPLREALEKGIVEIVLIQRGINLPLSIRKTLKNKNIPIKIVERGFIAKLCGHEQHGGVAFKVSGVKLNNPLEIIEKAVEEKNYCVFLDRIQDPQNLGAILRTAYLLGASGVILTTHHTVTITEAVIRASSGFAYHIPLGKVPNPLSLLTDAKKKGCHIVSFEKGGNDIRRVRIPLPSLLVFGGEDTGIRKTILEISDLIVEIPMIEKRGSLNLNSACSIGLFKALIDKEND